MKPLTAILAALSISCLAFGEQEEQKLEYKIPDGKTIPQPVKIDDDRISVGKAVINHKDGTVSFPAFFNMQEGLVEYLVNMPHGKIHECLLVTEADPLHISLAMKLAKFTAFEHFFPMRDENLEWLPFTQPKPEAYANAYVQIKVVWEDKSKKIESDCTDMIVNARTKEGFPANAWLYTNSFFYDNRFQASLTGDVISIFADRASPINYIGEFNDGINDSGWVINKEKTPEPGTPATVIISQKKQETPEPKATNQ